MASTSTQSDPARRSSGPATHSSMLGFRGGGNGGVDGDGGVECKSISRLLGTGALCDRRWAFFRGTW
jgi:hypothetical protein